MTRVFALFLLPFLALAACAETPSQEGTARILVMGDSLMTWHAASGRAIPDVMERALGEPVINRATTAARMIYALPISGAAGLNIPKQYREGPWEWIVVNGGGNDLWLGCGCHRCTRKLNRLINEDSVGGVIPDLLRQLRDTGAQVIYLGYLRTPGRDSPIDACKDESDRMEARIARFSRETDGLHFVSLTDLVPEGDLSFHALDRIHPSIKGSRAIGLRLSEIIQKNR